MMKSFRRGSGFDQVGFLNFLSPTHTPPPLSRPAGRKRGASCGRVFKGGKFVLDCTLTSKWPQCRNETLKSLASVAVSTPICACTSHLKKQEQMWLLAPLSAPAGVER